MRRLEPSRIHSYTYSNGPATRILHQPAHMLKVTTAKSLNVDVSNFHSLLPTRRHKTTSTVLTPTGAKIVMPLQQSISSKRKAEPLPFPRQWSNFIPTTLFQSLTKRPQRGVLHIVPDTAGFPTKLMTIQATSTAHINMTVTREDSSTQPFVAHPCNVLRPLDGHPKLVADSPRRKTSNPTVRHNAKTEHVGIPA